MNLLKESNDMLRSECDTNLEKYKKAKEEAEAAAKEVQCQ